MKWQNLTIMKEKESSRQVPRNKHHYAEYENDIANMVKKLFIYCLSLLFNRVILGPDLIAINICISLTGMRLYLSKGLVALGNCCHPRMSTAIKCDQVEGTFTEVDQFPYK